MIETGGYIGGLVDNSVCYSVRSSISVSSCLVWYSNGDSVEDSVSSSVDSLVWHSVWWSVWDLIDLTLN